MGETLIQQILKNFGLTEKESKVYIFLAKKGILKSSEIAKGSNNLKAETYRILKNLQSKGIIELTLESPTRYSAIPFETLLDNFIKSKYNEAQTIEIAREDVLNNWKTIGKANFETSVEKFVIIEGQKKIYQKTLQLINDAKFEFTAITTFRGLLIADQFGILDAAFNHRLSKKINFRFLTELSDQNVSIMKTLLRRIPKASLNIKGRNPDLGLKLFPRMVIKDNQEILFYITPKTDPQSTDLDEVCLWTNCKSLVQAFTAVFEDLWRNSSDIERKIEETETGKPTSKTYIINDIKKAYKMYTDAVDLAKEHIIMTVSSETLNELFSDPNSAYVQLFKGVSARIMAPITTGNLKTALKLPKSCEVRHVPTIYLNMTIIDEKHLFTFQSNKSCDNEAIGLASNFGNMFYTNDYEYIKKTKIKLNDIWKNASSVSQVTLETVLMPQEVNSESTSKKVGFSALKESTGITVIDKEPEVRLTEKDVIKEIIEAQKHPAKTFGDIVKLYSCNGQAIIHPPSCLKLPELLIYFVHAEKHSTYGTQDFMHIVVKRETPMGYRFVPSAFVYDTPEATEFWKKYFAGTPSASNLQLVKRDELEVQLHGNILFAGWTVTIPLLPPVYSLPPACIMLEGYGSLRTESHTLDLASGYKMVDQFNGFDAFVTFLHPSTNYSGPGTDGFLSREVISTVYPPEENI